MSKDARNEDWDLTAEEREKFGELVALLAKHGFGEEGPPRETTFAQIERFGHQAGQMVARAGWACFRRPAMLSFSSAIGRRITHGLSLHHAALHLCRVS